MTVKDLIKELKKYNGADELEFYSEYYGETLSLNAYEKQKRRLVLKVEPIIID